MVTKMYLEGYCTSFFRISPHISVLWWGMGKESVFGKIFRNNLCVHISLVFIELFI